MEFDSPDGGDDGEYNDVGFDEISKIFVDARFIFLWNDICCLFVL